MRLHLNRKIYIFAVFFVISSGFNVTPAASQEDPSDIYETDISDQMQVLDTGPMHEAFAETSSPDAQAGMVVPKSPPDPINEIPPEPEDLEEGAQWISGYWAWDDDRNDFIWISGTWRVAPPGRDWVQGYWVEVEQGYQWVSGYWADKEIEEAEYLPEPPESIEEGPNMDAPSPDYAWIPGCWVWLHGYYGWRPGYWELMRPDSVWVPAYYVWTPRGYIFAGGYWDYAILDRGVLFAPVYFYPPFFARLYFPFSPRFVIGLNIFSDCLFVRPAYRHYYFGNYYASKYHHRGIYPWFSKYAQPHGYDPLYAHQRYQHRNDRTWEKHMQATFNGRRGLEDKRPQMIEKKKMTRTNHRAPIVKNTGNALPVKQAGKNTDAVWDNAHMKQKEGRKKIDQKSVEQKNRRIQKIPNADSVDPSSLELVKRQKPINVKSPRNEVASKKVNTHEAKSSPYKNYRTPKSNPATNPAVEATTEPRLNNRNYRAPRPNPEASSVQETSNEPRLRKRDKRQIYRDQEQEIIDLNPQDTVQDSMNRGNQQVPRGRDTSRQGWGKSSNYNRGSVGNRWQMNNGRR